MSTPDTIPLDQLLKENKISQRTFDKATIAKSYIERKYNLKNTKNMEWNAIMRKIDSLKLSDIEKEKIKSEMNDRLFSKFRRQREKLTIRNYESLSIIGRGAFGEVHVCRDKKTNEIVAIKKIKKEVLYLKNQIIHVRNEQQLMAQVKSPWIVDLKASFQEDDYLYLVMEFLPGGDLMSLLIKKDIFTEDEARFYIAELILSIEEIHKLDCIHRDIKPDNVLIDKTGHVKLSDFGLAKISEKIFDHGNNNSNNSNNGNSSDNKPTHQKKNYSCVGTAYYVAPEVLNKKGYGAEIDWWSVGAIFFEMLVGYAPFCSKDTSEVCYKIVNWEKYLKIPSKAKVSHDAQDLIRKLINNSNERLGKRGAAEIKAHPFFKGFNWENVRDTKAPFVPELKSEVDTKYFEVFEVKESFYPPKQKNKKRKDIEYIGYTYKEEDHNGGNDVYKDDYLATMEFLENLKATTNANASGNNVNSGNNNVSNCERIQTQPIKVNSNSSNSNSNKERFRSESPPMHKETCQTIPNNGGNKRYVHVNNNNNNNTLSKKIIMIPESARRIKINCINKTTLNNSMRNKNSNSTGKTIQTINTSGYNYNNAVTNMKISMFNKNIGKPIRLSPSPPRNNGVLRSNSQHKTTTLNKSVSGSNIKNNGMVNGGCGNGTSRTKTNKVVYGFKSGQTGYKTAYYISNSNNSNSSK